MCIHIITSFRQGCDNQELTTSLGTTPSSHAFCLLGFSPIAGGGLNLQVLYRNMPNKGAGCSSKVIRYRKHIIFFFWPHGGALNRQITVCMNFFEWSTSPMHCIIITHRQKAWDDGVAPSYVRFSYLMYFLQYL